MTRSLCASSLIHSPCTSSVIQCVSSLIHHALRVCFNALPVRSLPEAEVLFQSRDLTLQSWSVQSQLPHNQTSTLSSSQQSINAVSYATLWVV